MREKVKKLAKHPLIYGSSIVVLGNLLVNFFNFLFNVFMTRNLSNADYGVLASIISVFSFPSLITAATIPLVINFAGTYFAKGNLDMARGFYYQIMKFFFVIGVILFIGFLLLIPYVSDFLHIYDMNLLVLTGFIIFLGTISVINIAFIQAKLAFKSQVMISFVGAVSKLIVGFIAIIIGYKVFGAVVAIFISALLAYLISFVPIKFVFTKNKSVPKIKAKELFSYGIPSMLTWVGLTSFITVDILLVKHFFDPTSAGIYAAMALIAKVIFYISSPIGAVMFPMIIQKKSNNESFSNTFNLSFLIVFAFAFVLTAGYFLFPEQAILFFTKKTENLIVSPILGFFGVFISLYSLLYIIANLYLSIQKTKVYIPILIGALLQCVLIYVFHQSFEQIITISVTITGFLVFGLFSHYYFVIRKHKIALP